MNRREFRQKFGTVGSVVLPVIHVLDTPRTIQNIDILTGEGAPGCFLINHDFGVDPFLPIVRDVRKKYPDIWLGLNFLAVTGKDAFPILGGLGEEDCPIDAYWADDARINEFGDNCEAEEMANVRQASGWNGLYFGGTAFKKQREVKPEHYEASAREAVPFMEVVTTSGVATGMEADLTKIEDFRRGIGDNAMALASGITPENAHLYADVDCFMVATGINCKDNFYDIDPERLRALIRTTEEVGAGHG